MEEEVNYASVVFTNDAVTKKEKTEDSTVYSDVKRKGPAATETLKNEAAEHSHSPALLVVLGILSVLLLASVIAIIFITVEMNQQKTNNSNLNAQIQRLNSENSDFKNKTEQLSRITHELNWMLRVIMTFNSFPVNEFCQDNKCQPCQTGWILFQEKCYLFYNKRSLWKTWPESRKYCQNTAADLAVIDSLQEQEFIRSNIKTYYDTYHGFWLGLQRSENGSWMWVDGRNDTLGYWTTTGTDGPCGLMLPERNLTASWDPAKCGFLNKFICERDALIRSN